MAQRFSTTACLVCTQAKTRKNVSFYNKNNANVDVRWSYYFLENAYNYENFYAILT